MILPLWVPLKIFFKKQTKAEQYWSDVRCNGTISHISHSKSERFHFMKLGLVIVLLVQFRSWWLLSVIVDNMLRLTNTSTVKQ